MSDTARPRTLRVGQSLELWRTPTVASQAWITEVALRQLQGGADALDINAGAGSASHAARTLAEAARLVRPVAPRVPLFLDSGDAFAVMDALDAVEGPLIANAVVLDEAAELVMLEHIARVRASAVLTPRLYDERRVASAEELADAFVAGVRRAREAGLDEELYLDCLAYPPAVDHERWLRSFALVRLVEGAHRHALLALGNVGHGSPGRTRHWLRLVTMALAHGAGVTAFLLPVEDRRLPLALALLDGERHARSAMDDWILDVAESGGSGVWPPPAPPEGAAPLGAPPEGAPPALVEAWRVVLGLPAEE